jgi:hypothetical protein
VTEILLPSDPEVRDRCARSMASRAFLTVWEGAVRSGKTVWALCAFALYATRSPDGDFLLSARTTATAETNCITGDYGLLSLIPGAEYRTVGNVRMVRFRTRQGEKRIHVVGASDIRSYMVIRGATFGGWLADEVNMHDRRFVSEALNRTAMSHDRRHMWTLNPDDPGHWIYSEYIDRYEAMDAGERAELGGFEHFWFRPFDNPAMTPAMLASLSRQYPEGTPFHTRYVLGMRCVAEGRVYPFFGPSCVAEPPEGVRAEFASIDFGSVHPTAMGWYGRSPDGTWWKVAEWGPTAEESARMTVADYMDAFERETERLGGIRRDRLTIDYGGGGEALVREAERRRWYPVNPDKSVLDGIQATAMALASGALRVSPSCRRTIGELSSYHWREGRGETAPDKVRDDFADETRYAVSTFIEPRIRRRRRWSRT